jgi:polyvinyl alcohol dehydrogenase (cytochrome)
MQAFDADTGEVLWRYDTVKAYESVNGASAHGGAIDGPGPVIANGWVYVTSGYAKFGALAGNVLLAFKKAN